MFQIFSFLLLLSQGVQLYPTTSAADLKLSLYTAFLNASHLPATSYRHKKARVGGILDDRIGFFLTPYQNRTYKYEFNISAEFFRPARHSVPQIHNEDFLGVYFDLKYIQPAIDTMMDVFLKDNSSALEMRKLMTPTKTPHIRIVTPFEYNFIKRYVKMEELERIVWGLLPEMTFHPTCIGEAMIKDRRQGSPTYLQNIWSYYIVLDFPMFYNIRLAIYKLFRERGGHGSNFYPNVYPPSIDLIANEHTWYAHDHIIKDASTCFFKLNSVEQDH
jgi:hypothetical protein